MVDESAHGIEDELRVGGSLLKQEAMEKGNKNMFEGAVSLKLCYCNSLPLKLHEAAVSSHVLTKLKVLNNCWVSITETEPRCENLQVGENGQKISNKADSGIILQLISFEDLLLKSAIGVDLVSCLEADSIYICEETAFNACSGNFDSFQSFLRGNKPLGIIKPVNDFYYSPPFATTATVSVARSPEVPFENEYDECLKTYFCQMRHLNKNQIFKISLNDSNRFDSRFNHLSHCLWFKVISMESEERELSSGWVQNGVTALFAKGSVNSFVPWINNQPKMKGHKLGDLTKGLLKYFVRITEIVRPIIEKYIHPSDAALLLHGPPAIGKRLLIRYLCEQFCMHFYEINCFNVIGESIAAVEQRIEAIFNKAIYCSPCVLLLRNIHALSKDRDGDESEPRLIRCISNCINNLTSAAGIVLVVATTNCYNEMSTDLCRAFTYEIEFEVPDEEARLETLIGLTQELDVNHCCLNLTAKKTAGMVLGDLRMLVFRALDISRKRTNLAGSLTHDVTQTDIDSALDLIHTEYKDTLGMPKIPDVSWNDVGGLADVKAEIIDTIKIPLLYPELTAKGLRRSGLLLYGPPGCGKTLLAKAVATEFSLNFFSVKGPELINMYVGQSEQNVRDMFQKARECSPCVVFFDELDSIAPNRGKSGDSGGVMDRVVSQLLAELDGMQASNELFVIGATNRPDLLDNALLRPGRFDKLVYVGFPETKSDRINIIKSYTNKMNLDENVDLDRIEGCLPLYLTGADFYALCSDALLNAIRRSIKLTENAQFDEDSDLVVLVNDFEIASQDLVPSISNEDVLKYKEIKRRIDFEKTSNSDN